MEDAGEKQRGSPLEHDPAVALSAKQVARNEAASRAVNEAIEDGRVTRDGPAGFVCECGRLGCSAVLELTLGEYESVRAHPRRFVIVPGHQTAVDVVIATADRYAVVAKQGTAGEIAEATDPRG